MKKFKCLFLTLLLLLSISGLEAADYVWVGGNGNWSDTTKWTINNGTYPDDALDNVSIPGTGKIVVDVDGLTVNNIEFTAKGNMDVNVATFTCNNLYLNANSYINTKSSNMTISGILEHKVPGVPDADYTSTDAQGLNDKRGAIESKNGSLNINDVKNISDIWVDGGTANITTITDLRRTLGVYTATTVNVDSSVYTGLVESWDNGTTLYITGSINILKLHNSANLYAYRQGDTTVGYDLTVADIQLWDAGSFLQGPVDEPLNTEANLSLDASVAITADVRDMFNNVTLGSNVNITTASDLTIYGTLDASGSTVTSTSTNKGFTVYDITSLNSLVVDDLVLGKRTDPTTYLQDGTYNLTNLTKNGTGGVHLGASTLNITGTANTFDISSNGGILILNSGTLNLIDIHLNTATITDPWADQLTTSVFKEIYLSTATAILSTATKGLTVNESVYGLGDITSTGGALAVTDNLNLTNLTVSAPGTLSVGLDSNITNLSLTSVNFSPGENLFTTNTTFNSSTLTIGSGKEFTVTGTYVDVVSTINANNSRISINSATNLTTLNLGSDTVLYLTGSSQTVDVTTLIVGTNTEFDINNNTLNLDDLTGVPIITSSGGAVDMGTSGSAYIKGSFKDAVAVGSFTYVGDVELIGPGGDIEAATVDSNSFRTTISGTSTIIGTTINLTDVYITGTGNFTLNNSITVSGDWNNLGTFNHGTQSVTFDDASRTSNISGSNTFNSLICTTNSKSLVFEAGETQTITNLTLTSTNNAAAIALSSSIPGTQWNINHGPGTLTTQRLLVSDSNASGSSGNLNVNTVGAGASYDGGGNNTVGNQWIGFTTQNSWTALGGNTNWNNASNWTIGVPVADENQAQGRAVIPAGAAYYPKLTADADVGIVIINSGAEVDLNGFALNPTFSFRNFGTLRINSGANITRYDDGSGTVEFYGAVANTSAWVGDFYNLKINTPGNVTLNGSSRINNQLDIVAGTLVAGTSNITVVGDINIYDETGFTHSGQLFIIDGDSRLTGSMSFSSLTVNSGMSLTLNSPISVNSNIVKDGNFFNGGNKVTFTGSSNISSSSAGNSIEFDDIEINPGINVTLSTNIDTLKVSGDLIKTTGTLISTGKSVEFTGSGSSTIYGDSSFTTLSCSTPGKTLIFESNKTQTIENLNLLGSEAGLITLKPTDYLSGNFILNLTGGADATENFDLSSAVDYVDVTSSSLSGNSVDAQYHSIDSGGNDISEPVPKWIFRKDIYIWNGSENTFWANKNNWEKSSNPGNPVLFLPGSNDWVQIPNTVNKPVVTTPETLKSLNIAVDSSIELSAGASLTLTYFNNNGTVKISDNGASINKIDVDSGTVEFIGITDISSFWASYHDLKVSGAASGATGALSVSNDFILSADLSLSNTLVVNRDLYLTSGTLTSNSSVTVDGDWFTSIGQLSGTNTVYFTGTSSISGSTTFNNLQVSSGGNLTLSNDIEVNDIILQGTLNSGSATIKINRDWTNSGIFNRDSGTVEFLAGVGASTITGDTVFNVLKCISPNKTISFTTGSNQSFYDLDIAGTSGNLIILQGTAAANWTFTNLKGSEAQVSYVSLFYGQVTDSGATGSIRAVSSINDVNTDTGTGSSFWIIDNTARIMTWIGDHGTNPTFWSEATNWHVSGADAATPPTSIDSVIIPTTTNDPVLQGSVEVNDLTVQVGGILDSVGFDITINGSMENSGTVKRSGTSAQNINKTDIDSGKVIYEGVTAANIQLYTGVDYYDLEVTGDNKTVTGNMEIAGDLIISATTVDFSTNTTTLTISGSAPSIVMGNVNLYNLTVNKSGGSSVTLSTGINIANNLSVNSGIFDMGAAANPVAVNNNIDINGGTLTAGDAVITLKGNWSNNLGTFNRGTSSIIFTDSSKISLIKGNNDFYDLSCIIPSKTIKFTAGSSQSVFNNLVITGGNSGNQIGLISSLSGVSWNFASYGTSSVQNVNLGDSFLYAGTDINVLGNSNDLGNNKITPAASPIWIFIGSILHTWIDAGVPGVWSDPNNWDQPTYPNDPTHDVLIPVAGITNFPTLSEDINVEDIEIVAGASLFTKDFDLIIASSITNNGILYRWGGTIAAPQNISKIDSINGTVIYDGVIAGNVQSYVGGYKILKIATDTKTAIGDILINAGGSLTIEDGAVLNLDIFDLDIITAGSYSAGTTGTGKLQLVGTGVQAISGLVVTPGTDVIPGFVDYTGLVTGLIADYRYTNLIFSGTGAVSFPSALTVTEDLIINSTITTLTPSAAFNIKDLEIYGAAELRMTTNNLLVTGTTNAVAGATVGRITSTTGTQEFRGVFNLKELTSSTATTTFKGTSVNISNQIAAYTAGSVVFDGVTTLSAPLQAFFNVEHRDAGILSVISDLDIDGALLITAGSVDLNKVNGIYSIVGDVTGPAIGSGTLDAATQTSGSLSLGNVGNASATSLLVFYSPAGGVTPNVTVSGNWNVNTFTSGGSSLKFIGGDTTIVSNSQNLGNIEIIKTLNSNRLTQGDVLNTGNITVTKGVLTTGTNNLVVTGNITGVLTNGTISDDANVISLTGDWNVPGFSDSTGTVEFKGASTSVSNIYGNNTFNVLKCIAPGKVLKFEQLKTQSFTDLQFTGNIGDYIVLNSIDGTQRWTFDNLSGGVETVIYIEVWNGNVSTNSIEANFNNNRDGSADNGNNDNHEAPPYWDFMKPVTYYWRGTTDTTWDNVTNWEPNGYPVARDTIILNHSLYSITNNLEIKADRTVVDFTVTEGAALSIKDDGGQYTLATTGNFAINDVNTLFTINDNIISTAGTFNNSGTIIRSAGGVLHPEDSNSGTVRYIGTGPITAQNIAYWNLEVALTSGSLLAGANLTINRDLTVSTGKTLDLGTSDLVLFGHNTDSAGVITGNSVQSQVYHRGGTLNAGLNPFNFNNLTLDLHIDDNAGDNSVDISTDFSIISSGNIIFDDPINGSGSNSLSVSSPGKSVTFNGIVGGGTPIGGGAAGSPFSLTAVNIIFNQDAVLAVTGNLATISGNTTFNNSSISSGSALTFTGGILAITSSGASESITTTDTLKHLTFEGAVTTNKPLNCISSGNIDLKASITSSILSNPIVLEAVGNIIDGTGAETSLVTADSVTLKSTGGSVGSTAAGDIDIDCLTVAEASSALGGVYITQVADRDLNLTYVNSTNGNIEIRNEAVTPGSGDIFIDSGASKGISADITDDIVTLITINGEVIPVNLTADTNIEITGYRLDIQSGGAFGTSANQMDIDVTGELNITAVNESWIYDRAGVLPLKTLTVTGAGAETRITSSGNITQITGGKITSEKLLLSSAAASTSFGVSGTPLKTDINNLEATTTSNIFIEEDNSLTIGGISGITGVAGSGGEISLTILGAGNTLTVNESITSGWNLYLSTNNGDLTLNANLTCNEILNINTNTGAGNIVINSPILNHGDGTMTFSSGTGTTTLNSNITSDCVTPGVDSKKITFSSPILLGGGSYSISTTLPASIDLDVEFASTVNNPGSLIINAGLGYVDFNGLVGNITGITGLNVTGVRSDFIGLAATGDLNVTTPLTDGVILFEGGDYNLGGNIVLNAGNDSSDGGIYISAASAKSFNVTGDFTASATSTTYFYGNNNLSLTGASFNFSDLHISLPGATLSVATNLTAENIVLYNGNLDLGGNILAVNSDLVLLGAGYSVDDPDTGVTGIFKYDPSPSFVRQGAVNTVLLGDFIGIYDPSYIIPSYTGEFLDLIGSTVSVGKNFYNNGCNMPGTGLWTLNLVTDSDSGLNAFAEAYNMSVGNSNSSRAVAASESVTVTGTSTNWFNIKPALDTGAAGIHTKYDDIINIFLTSGSFENSNNEISAAVISGAIGINNNTVTGVNLGSYIDDPSTPGVFDLISTDGQGDLSQFYLKVENDNNRWNTDATGSSPGAGTSTDRGRTGVAPVNRTTVPNIDINKNTASLYFTLRDSNKNRITHTVGASRITDVKDGASPVIISVIASKHGATGDSVDSHNYFEITFSESVNFNNSLGISIFPQNTRSSSVVLNTSPNEELGYISQTGTEVVVNGLFKYSGNYSSGSFDGIDNTNALYTPTPNKLRIDVVSFHNGTKWPGYLGSTETNRDNYIKITNPSPKFIHGDFNGELTALRAEFSSTGSEPDTGLYNQLESLSKTVTVLSNPDLIDLNGNVIEDSSSIYNQDAYFKTLTIGGTGWDVFPPFISRLSTTTQDNPIYEIYFMDEKNNVGDRIVDNIGFLILDDHIMQPFWDSLTGWTGGTTETGILPNPLGGIRDFYGSSILSLSNYQAFTYGVKDSGVYNSSPTISGSTNVENNILSGYTTTIYSGNDPYFSIEFSPQGWILKDKMSMAYDSAAGQITDLAGNLMPSSNGLMNCFQWIPPEIILTLAQVGSKTVYLQFSKGVYGNVGRNRTGISSDYLTLTNSSNSITAINSVNGIDGMAGEDEFLITLSEPLSPNDMVNSKIGPSSNKYIYDLAGIDIDGNYTKRVSDLGIGLLTLYAEDTMHRDNNLLVDGALRIFDGSGRLLPEDIVVAGSVAGDSNQSYDLSLLYAVNPDLSAAEDYNPRDNVFNPKIWLPEGESIVGITKFTDLNITEVQSAGENNGFRLFPVDNADPNIIAGNNFQFIFKLNTTPEPLYCVTIPVGGSTLSDLEPWQIALSEIKRQRGGVTIINNVINPLHGNKTELLLDQDKPGMCTIIVVSIDGNIVRKLHSGRQAAGTYRYQWDGKNKSGTPVARGMYFIKVVAPGIDESRKVMIVK